MGNCQSLQVRAHRLHQTAGLRFAQPVVLHFVAVAFGEDDTVVKECYKDQDSEENIFGILQVAHELSSGNIKHDFSL